MAGRKYSNAGNKKGNMKRVGFPLPRRKPTYGRLKPREELNIGPATPIGRGPKPLNPRAHRVARDIVGSVASMGALGAAGKVGHAVSQIDRTHLPLLKPTLDALRATGVSMRGAPRGLRLKGKYAKGGN